MFRWWAVLALASACGRFDFDPRSDGVDALDAAAQCDVSLPRANHRSIGAAVGALAATGLARIDSGRCLVTFDGALPRTVGPGDRLRIGGEELYVRSVLGSTRVVLDQPAATTHPGEPFVIERAYSSFGMWEADRQGDLVADDRTEVGVGYADGAALQSVIVAGSMTDATHHMRLTAAIPHHGHPGAGVVLDGQNIDCFGVEVHDNYTVIEDLELVRFNPDTNCGPAGVYVAAANVLVRRLLVHDFKTTNLNASSAVRLTNSGGASVTIENMIAYDGRVGARIPSATVGDLTVLSSSIYDMLDFGVEQNGTTGSTVTVTNTIACGLGGGDFAHTGIGAMATMSNISCDASASGPGAITGVTAASVFASITAGAEDLHLAPGAIAIDAGTDLSASFTDDIDGEPRPAGAWDIGADER